MSQARYFAVMPAAGMGRRMGADRPKQYLPLGGGCLVVEHTVHALLSHPRIEGLAVALHPEDPLWRLLHWPHDKPIWLADGGAERCHSVANALAVLSQHADPQDWVLVHDAARPCLQHEDIDRLIEQLSDDPVGGLLAIPVRDTLKRAEHYGRVAETVNRDELWHALTPQMFRLGQLQHALAECAARGVMVTDESSAMEAIGLAPRLIEGRADNLKITRPEDLALAEFYLKRWGR